jgi:hypothetical protein
LGSSGSAGSEHDLVFVLADLSDADGLQLAVISHRIGELVQCVLVDVGS